MERELAVECMVYMKMMPTETYEEACDRFFNQMYEGLCEAVDYGMDFNIYDSEEREC